MAERTPDGWKVETVGWTKVLRAALALDVNGQPALAFYSVPNGGIYVAMKPLLNEKLFLPFVGR